MFIPKFGLDQIKAVAMTLALNINGQTSNNIVESKVFLLRTTSTLLTLDYNIQIPQVLFSNDNKSIK